MTSIIGFIVALPQLIANINQLMALLNKVSGNDPAGFLLRSAEAFKVLNEAKTQEEHSGAAKAISDLIRSLPSK